MLGIQTCNTEEQVGITGPISQNILKNLSFNILLFY